jgi:hypothetical protein
MLLRPLNSLNPIRNRTPTFLFAISEITKKKNPIIVETGCSRKDHGTLAWGDDGCSTFLFDLFTLPGSGRVYSVDISIKNVSHVLAFVSDRVSVTCADSVAYLSSFQSAQSIDLLYLDSYDFDPARPELSQMHHLNEIKSIYPRLKSGCLILVDDVDIPGHEETLGKGKFVKKYLEEQGVHPTISSYQMLWIKP